MGPSRDGFTVSEGDCDIELCFIKNMDTAGAITVNIFIVELPFEGNAATGTHLQHGSLVINGIYKKFYLYSWC